MEVQDREVTEVAEPRREAGLKGVPGEVEVAKVEVECDLGWDITSKEVVGEVKPSEGLKEPG